MEKGLAIFTFLILLFLVTKIVAAGSADVWAVCGSAQYPINTGTKTMSGTTYYCCPGPLWQAVQCGCSCTSWSNVGCNQGGCLSNQMYQTRSCTPSGCALGTRCVGPSYGSWTNQGCGVSCGTAGTCLATQQCQKRSDSYGCAVDQYQCVADAGCGGGTTTTTTLVTGCVGGVANNNCEAGEKQDDCPDCKTTVTLSKQDYLTAGEEVTVNVTFTDGRYTAGEEAMISLTIIPQGCASESCYVTWTESNGCDICNKKWNETLGWNKADGWTGMHKGMTYSAGSTVIIASKNYDASIVFKAKIPNIPGGRHTLKAVPTIYSVPITLKAAETEINIFDGFFKLITLMREIAMKKTGLFFIPSLI